MTLLSSGSKSFPCAKLEQSFALEAGCLGEPVKF